MDVRKAPTAASRKLQTGQRARYSPTRTESGVITGWRKSDGGKVSVQSRSRRSVRLEGQHVDPSEKVKTYFSEFRCGLVLFLTGWQKLGAKV